MVTTVDVPFGAAPAMPHLPVNLDPLVPVIRRTLSDANFFSGFRMFAHCLDSSPFVNVSLVSLKSAPYVYYSDKVLVQEFDNGISCRLRYFEAAITSLAAVIYNFVFGIVFSVLSLVTLGRVKMIVDQMGKHWAHSVLAVAAFGIAAIGTVSPNLGIKANYAAGLAVAGALLDWTEGEAISKICSAYQRHRQEFAQGAAMVCLNDGIPQNTFTPFLNYLNDHLNNRVESLSDLMGVVQNGAQRLPNITPWVTPQVLVNELLLLGSNLMSGPVTTTGVETA
jgi:hypothetical protein